MYSFDMKIGIIGPPQSGKTTLFKTLVGPNIEHIGVVKISDERLENLAHQFNSKKITNSELKFLDIGFPASKKEVSKAHESDCLVLVIGVFSGGDSRKELEQCWIELMLADLEIVQNRIARVKKELSSGKIEAKKEFDLLNRCESFLSDSKPLWKMSLLKEEKKLLMGYQFLSLKPILVVANLKEEDSDAENLKSVREFCQKESVLLVETFVRLEQELLELKEEERINFMKELGIAMPLNILLVNKCHEALNLVTFFTVVGTEARAWIIEANSSALEAAGKVHTDMMKGFIRAEVINYTDFIKLGSLQKAHEAGALRLEGKDYIVKDGDIIQFRFNV